MRSIFPVTRPARNAALTLVELLVVLTIVAVLSTVALRNVVGTLDQKNYDANVSQLEEIGKAVLGDGEAAGFLGDIGRLPIAVGDAGSANLEQLRELWDRDSTRDAGMSEPLPPYAINTPVGDAEVRLGTGWRGPYLNPGINRSDLADGFVNRYFLYQADGEECDDADPIAIVQSLGAAGTVGGSGYEEDLEVVFEADAGAVTAGLADAETDPDPWRRDLQVTVVRDGGPVLLADGAHLVVRAYGADGSGGLHTVIEEKLTLTADLTSHPFTLSDLPHGAKIIRAYQESTDPADKDAPISTASPERKSPATHVVVDRFTNAITLTLY